MTTSTTMRSPFPLAGRRSGSTLLACGLLLLAACESPDGTPTEPGLDVGKPAVEPVPAAVTTKLDCTVDVAGGGLACARPDEVVDATTGTADLVIGGQNTFVTLTSSNVCYEDACAGGAAGDENFQADVTVENLIPQALATTDGASGDGGGVRVLFHSGPTVTTGTGSVSIANADGTATFTASDQPFFQYGGTPVGGATGDELGPDGLLSENETSASRQWRWQVPSTVGTFAFAVYVSAAVQHPDGWVEIAPPSGRLDAGGAEALTGTVYDAVGRPVAGRTLTWSTSDAEVATVDASGVVTGQGTGLATVTASSDGPESSGSTTLNVDAVLVDAAATGAADGLTWADAHPNLQDALAAAASGDEIWVAPGTYYPDEGAAQTAGDRTASFALVDSVGIYGGFAGAETRRGQRDPYGAVPTLSGDIGTPDDFSDNSYRVVTAGSGIGATAVLDGFTITRADASAATDRNGGGMQIDGGSPTLANLAFVRNAAKYGGGLYAAQSSATLTNVTFVGNQAVVGDGGGMYNLEGAATLTNVAFTGNDATYYGGGLFNMDASPVLTNVTASGNSAGSGAGGLYIDTGPVGQTYVLNAIVWGNAAATAVVVYQAPGESITIGSSIIEGSGGSGGSWDTALGTDGGGNLDVDPTFVDPDGADNTTGTTDDDVRLQTGSPAIDAGSDAALPADAYDLDGDGDTAEPLSTDPDGAQRIVGGTVDMGAYENQDAASPALSVSPADLNFGAQAVGTTSDTLSTTVTNTGTADLVVTDVFLSGADASQFVITGEGCTDGPVAPGHACSIDVVFEPYSAGAKTADITVTSDTAGSEVVTVAGSAT